MSPEGRSRGSRHGLPGGASLANASWFHALALYPCSLPWPYALLLVHALLLVPMLAFHP